MIRRWQKRIPLLESRVKREMEKVERAEKGAFNWNDFLFPAKTVEAPLKKPGDFQAALTEALLGSESDPRFIKVREAQFA